MLSISDTLGCFKVVVCSHAYRVITQSLSVRSRGTAYLVQIINWLRCGMPATTFHRRSPTHLPPNTPNLCVLVGKLCTCMHECVQEIYHQQQDKHLNPLSYHSPHIRSLLLGVLTHFSDVYICQTLGGKRCLPLSRENPNFTL